MADLDIQKNNAQLTANLLNQREDETENLDDLAEFDLDKLDSDNPNLKSNRASTDLVRLYLQEIGRIPLLRQDQEVTQAQRVQAYMCLLELRNQAAKKGDPILKDFVHLLNAHDQLASQLTHRPPFKKWADAVQMDVTELKQALKTGKRCWAALAQIEVQELEEIQKIGLEAKQNMIKANLRLVVSVAKKYQNRGLELLDLIQEGTLGLERAVEKFDPTKGYRFSTYAYWWIRQGITRAIATFSRTIRIPVHITEKLNKIKKAQRKISQQKGRTAKLEDVAQELNMTVPQLQEVLSKVPRSVSLEIRVGKEKDTELVDLLENPNDSPEQLLMKEALQRELQYLLADLTTREREVIQMRFGLMDGKSYSLADIGRALDLSRERVRQVEAKALQKLRQPKFRNRVRDYLDTLN